MLGQSGGHGHGDDAVSGQKTVVFLPCRASWWKSMEPLWRMYSQDEMAEVHVLPIFYYDCDHKGNIGEKHDERALFPEYLKVEACEKFDFAGIHPDVIVTQVPYDGFNTAFTVHEFFYSANLLRFTDELIYVPCLDMDPPVDEEDKAATAISVFVEQEAVVNADKVVLANEELRQLYIKKLVELSSEDTRQYWQQKVVTLEGLGAAEADLASECAGKKVDDRADDGKAKTVIYYVGLSSLLRYGSEAIEKIRENLDVFDEAGDKLQVVLIPQEQILEDLENLNSQVFREFMELVDSCEAKRSIIYDSNGEYLDRIEEWSAYYGDASPYVRKCVVRKIPVMIQNYEIRKN
jgi:hypothetical protein